MRTVFEQGWRRKQKNPNKVGILYVMRTVFEQASFRGYLEIIGIVGILYVMRTVLELA